MKSWISNNFFGAPPLIMWSNDPRRYRLITRPGVTTWIINRGRQISFTQWAQIKFSTLNQRWSSTILQLNQNSTRFQPFFNHLEIKVDSQRWFNVESTLRINLSFQGKYGWSSTLIQRWINVDDQPYFSWKLYQLWTLVPGDALLLLEGTGMCRGHEPPFRLPMRFLDLYISIFFKLSPFFVLLFIKMRTVTNSF